MKAKTGNKQGKVELLRLAGSQCVLFQSLERCEKFGVLSAYSPERNTADNRAGHLQLKEELAELNYKVIELTTGYGFEHKGIIEKYEEQCWLILQPTFYSLIVLARKYKQRSFIFNDYNGFNLVSTDNGRVLKPFGKCAGHAWYTTKDVVDIFAHYFKSRTTVAVAPVVDFLHESVDAGKKRKQLTNFFN